MTDQLTCPWCKSAFEPRQSGGRPQRFCSNTCTSEFYDAVRRYTLIELEEGRLTPQDVRQKVLGKDAR